MRACDEISYIPAMVLCDQVIPSCRLVSALATSKSSTEKALGALLLLSVVLSISMAVPSCCSVFPPSRDVFFGGGHASYGGRGASW